MSIYRRAVRDTTVDRRIVRAVDRVLGSLPVPGGVFGRVDVWNALQANAKEARVPLNLDQVQVGKALDALCLACILTCRGGAYSEVIEVPPLRVEVPAVPAEPPAVAEVGPAEPELSPMLQAVIDVLRAGPLSTRDLCRVLGCTESAVRSRTHRLRGSGLICEVGAVPMLGRGMPMTVWGLTSHGTREVPSPAPMAEVVPPAPVKAEPWTARPKEGPDEAGRWRWEARATLETRVSRGLGWLAEDEVLPALQALGQPMGEDGATGPAWPSLRNLDVEQAEATIAQIERRCAAWRTLLAAAREVAA